MMDTIRCNFCGTIGIVGHDWAMKIAASHEQEEIGHECSISCEESAPDMAEPTIALRYWIPLSISLSTKQILQLDKEARMVWEIDDSIKLPGRDIIGQAARRGLLILPEDYDVHDDLGIPADFTRAELEQFLQEQGESEPRTFYARLLLRYANYIGEISVIEEGTEKLIYQCVFNPRHFAIETPDGWLSAVRYTVSRYVNPGSITRVEILSSME